MFQLFYIEAVNKQLVITSVVGNHHARIDLKDTKIPAKRTNAVSEIL